MTARRARFDDKLEGYIDRPVGVCSSPRASSTRSGGLRRWQGQAYKLAAVYSYTHLTLACRYLFVQRNRW